MVRRVIPFVLTAAILYGLAPAVLEVFGAWDDVDDVEPWWWVAVIGTQSASLVCFVWLQRISLERAGWFAVATSNLAGGALGRVVPGGAATTAALQYRMLTQAGVRPGLVATGLGAGSLLLIAALAGLPVLTLPFVLGGLRVPETLAEAALLGGAVFVALFALGAVLFIGEGAIGGVGRVARWTMRKVRRDPEVYADLPERLTARRDQIRGTLGERWPEAVAAALGRWILDFLTLVAALTAVGARPNLALALLAYVAAQLLAQVPLTPGGLGVVEAGMTATLALAGVPAAAAAAATLAYRLASYWLQLPAGLVAYVLHRRRFGGPPPAEAVP